MDKNILENWTKLYNENPELFESCMENIRLDIIHNKSNLNLTEREFLEILDNIRNPKSLKEEELDEELTLMEIEVNDFINAYEAIFNEEEPKIVETTEEDLFNKLVDTPISDDIDLEPEEKEYLDNLKKEFGGDNNE